MQYKEKTNLHFLQRKREEKTEDEPWLAGEKRERVVTDGIAVVSIQSEKKKKKM